MPRLFDSFRGLGSSLVEPNQSLQNLTKHSALCHFRSIANSKGRLIRFGFGENLSVQFAIIASEASLKQLQEEEDVEYLALLCMLNLHPQQTKIEEAAAALANDDSGEDEDEWLSRILSLSMVSSTQMGKLEKSTRLRKRWVALGSELAPSEKN